jgi:hypothetical protein
MQMTHNQPMAITEFLPTEGSTVYVVGSRVAAPESPFLTVAKVLEEQQESALVGPGQQSDAYDELETRAIEENAPFHRAIVERISTKSASLVDADDLL